LKEVKGGLKEFGGRIDAQTASLDKFGDMFSAQQSKFE
jgi:hypothetical protein